MDLATGLFLIFVLLVIWKVYVSYQHAKHIL